MTHASPVRWRRMAQADLGSVERLGDVVHPTYPEDAAIVAERLRLHPAGCLVLDGEGGLRGYAVGHPWLWGQPPALNTRLGRLPLRADTFHVHDLALLPDARGGGFGTQAVNLLLRQAGLGGLRCLSLVAVGGSLRFWRKNGFQVVTGQATGAGLASYGEGAALMARALL